MVRPPGLGKAKYKPRQLWFCRGCERRWSGGAQAHCTACHEHFSTAKVFDMHFRGTGEDRTCVRPETLKRPDGQPYLKQTAQTCGQTWTRTETTSHLISWPRRLTHDAEDPIQEGNGDPGG